jgi:hypothetical protein
MHQLTKPAPGFAIAFCVLAMLWSVLQLQDKLDASKNSEAHNSDYQFLSVEQGRHSSKARLKGQVLAMISTSKDEYHVGDNIEINYLVKNAGSTPITLNLRDSELIVNGRPTDELIFTGICDSHFTLEPGEEASCLRSSEWVKHPGQYELAWNSPILATNKLNLTVKR